jgi:hypothetical protein
VKVHYFKHRGGGAAALAAHGAHIEREGARLDRELKPYADSLSRDGEQGFCDATRRGVDGRDLTLAPKPAGLDVATGQKVMAGMKDGLTHVMRALGIDR